MMGDVLNSKSFRYLSLTFLLGIFVLFTPWKEISSFCGFYVAKADASLFNKASRIVYVHNEKRSVITMMNDYKGELKDFAIVVPVPVVLQKDQIHIGDPKIVDHIDAYSAPRLVEYFDSNPCHRYEEDEYKKYESSSSKEMVPTPSKNKGNYSGVTIEATYTIGEYTIQILSAKFSSGLESWLIDNGYKVPKGASSALQPYIRQNMKFFVAKVDLKEQANTGLTYLRPIQFAFESPKFMLPIRLGMINADGPQDLLIYVLSKEGRVESTNYRTIKLPSDLEVPVFVKKEFADFYRSMFSEQVRKENGKAVFTEYVWNMGSCDPCSAEPLTNSELQSLGVFWIGDSFGGQQVLITRLHVRYESETFPEDLMFQETKDAGSYQGRYILNHPWAGSANECSAAKTYFKDLQIREEQRAKNLAMLTGWDLNKIYSKMNLSQKPKEDDTQWWKKIWK
jgi:hypothetical protein